MSAEPKPDQASDTDKKLKDDSDPYTMISPASAVDGIMEAHAKLKVAMEQDSGLPWRSLRGFQMCILIFAACCCSGDSGFDSTVMGAVNSMTQYQAYFNMESAGASTGIVFGIYTVGQVCAAIPAAYLPDKLGRRWCMFLGNLCLIAGAFITAEAQNRSMFIGGRFLTGFGCGTAAAGAKNYLVEIAPPHTRGRFLGLMNSSYYFGQIIATGITIATGRMSNDFSWRIPMHIQAVPAFLNFAIVLFLPESPRWLYSRGKTDEAVRVLAKYHSQHNDVNSPLVHIEIEEIKAVISLEGADKRWYDFRPLFMTRADRYRIALVAIIAFWGQFSGNGLVTYFLPVLLEQAGITSPDRQRVLNFVNSITSMVGALTGTAIIDHFGRRKLLLSATAVDVLNMAIICGLLSSTNVSSARAQAGIAFIFWFMVCFSFGFTPMQAAYPAEVLAFESRAKGLALSVLMVQGVSCINTFAMPVSLKNIQGNTYIIFVVINAIGFLVVYFVCPETKKLSLEELDRVFEAKNPVKFSLDTIKEGRARMDAEEAAAVRA